MTFGHTFTSAVQFRAGLLLAAVCCVSSVAVAQSVEDAGLSLHERIDQAIEQKADGPVVDLAADTTLIRRLYLDLHGMIPPADAVREFAGSDASAKYQTLVDSLLANPRHARHMATVWDVTLMERRADKQVGRDEWHNWLFDAFSQDRPYNELVAEMLAADGTVAAQRTPAKFVLERDVEPNLLTRDIGRVFFGRDLQCAQCHDHPLIDHYRQADYYGLYAFVNRSYPFADKKLKKNVVAEKADGDANFQSVFTGEGETVFPRLPGGEEVVDVSFKLGQEYQVKPAKDVRPVPAYSRREQLADQILKGNRTFARTFANRLWGHMFGRALVHPADLDHPDNPPAHPAVLELLTDEVIANGYQMKPILKQLAMTRAYRRRFDAVPVDSMPEMNGNEDLATLQAQRDQLNQQLEAATTQFEEALQQRIETSDAYEAVYAKGKDPKAALTKAFTAETDLQAKLKTSQATAASQSAARTALQAALDKTQQASKLVGENDKELAAAVADLVKQRDRVAKLEAASVAAAQKQQQELPKLTEARSKQEAAVEAWRSELAKVDGPYRTARQLYTERNRALQQVVTQLRVVEGRIETLEHLAQVDQQRTELATARSRVQSVGQTLPELQKRAGNLKTELDQHEAQLKSASQSLQQAKAGVAQVKQSLQEIAQASAAIDQALQDIDKAPLEAQQGEIISQFETAREVLAVRQKVVSGQLPDLMTRQQQAEAAHKQLAQAAAAASKRFQAASEAMKAAEQQLATDRERVESLQLQLATSAGSVQEDLVEHFQAREIVGLTPEQFAWSAMQASGLLANQVVSSQTALKKEDEKKAPADASPAAFERRLEQAVYDKLKGNQGEFVKLYAAGAGQPQGDFFATVDQALYLSNGGRILSWLNASGNNLTARAAKLEQPTEIAEELYLSILSRFPTQSEVADVESWLAGDAKERPRKIQELAWALISSAEFRFNH